MTYRVELDNFAGPLDLLLFLIKKNEVDLFDIPIAKITKQYLEYLDVIKMLDLEGASDFILMAATLIRIKAKLLLPKPPIAGDEEEEEDPRDELVRQLLEYQRFKEVSHKLGEIEEHERLKFRRAFFADEYENGSDEAWVPSQPISLFDLIGAFRQVLQRAPKITHHSVEQVPVTAEEQITFILSRLDANNGQVLFYEMIESLTSRVAMIVTFLALLELIKRSDVVVTQSSTFGEIWIHRRAWSSVN